MTALPLFSLSRLYQLCRRYRRLVLRKPTKIFKQASAENRVSRLLRDHVRLCVPTKLGQANYRLRCVLRRASI